MGILITNKKDKLIEYFLNNPNTEVHLRELARNTRISFPWVRKMITNLARNSYIIQRRQGGLVLVKANRDSVLFRALKRSYNLFSLYKSGFIYKLIDVYNKPEAIVLFGSYSRGEDTEDSDIDIAVITKREVKIDLREFERRLHRKIKILEIKGLDIEKEFLNSLINGIIIYGYMELK